jgi:glyoxylase-like metal-dependent hydrolase (beta-lactamase superfamily II)/8-oxo-dGTP pyrophosphatase MutT (NUDIX family)
VPPAEEATSSGPAIPRPAATVVLVRPGNGGLEVLLTHRPPSMAFAPDVHVFPGGRVDAADADPALAARSVVTGPEAAEALGGNLEPGPAMAAHVAAIRELFEEAGVLLAETPAGRERVAAARSALLGGTAAFPGIAEDLDLRLRTDRLVPLSRWVTPPTLPRRFDARFFVAELPEGVEPTFEGDEVLAHGWLRPADALDAMANGALPMWLPTSTTIQQLEHAATVAEVRDRLSPRRLGPVEVETVAPGVTRIVMPAGGGIAGQPVCAYLVGRDRFVLVDPGDPTGPALDRALRLVADADGILEAIVLTHVDPDHAAGAEAVAEQAGVSVLVGPGGSRWLPSEVAEIADDVLLPAGDIPLRVVATPGIRPDHLAFVDPGGAFVIAGDLDGVRGARTIPGPVDEGAIEASRARVRALAPAARWLTGHPMAGER